jgi:hypothetical protein
MSLVNTFRTGATGVINLQKYKNYIYIGDTSKISLHDLSGNIIINNLINLTHPFVIIDKYLYAGLGNGTSAITRYTLNENGTLDLSSKNDNFFIASSSIPGVASNQRLYAYKNYICMSTGSNSNTGVITVDPINGNYIEYRPMSPIGQSHAPAYLF